MTGLLEIPGRVVWLCFIFLRWLRIQISEILAHFTDHILAVWEESLKSIVRETFNVGTRSTNTFFTWCLKVFGKDPGDSADKTKAWQAWWKEDRQSSLNAFIASHSPSKRLRRPKPRKDSLEALHSDTKPTEHGWQSRMRFEASRWRRAIFGPRSDTSREPRRSLDSPSSRRRFLRSGSDLFDRPSGYAVESPKRGILEDVRMSIEMGVTSVIDALRRFLKKLFLVPEKPHSGAHRASFSRASSAPLMAGDEIFNGRRSFKSHRSIRRSRSVERMAPKTPTTAGDAIRAAGYPLQIHTITTPDGYILQMERIPRPGVRDVVFFMHGILDTSMGWVANGTGSQAFAAFDQGMDVWLGSSRSNPPREHRDQEKKGPKYWNYSVNEMGTEDCMAQIDHIHVTKCQELHVNAGPPPSHQASRKESFSIDKSPLTAKALRRSSSDSAIEALAEALGGATPVFEPPSPPGTTPQPMSPQSDRQRATQDLEEAGYDESPSTPKHQIMSQQVFEPENDDIGQDKDLGPRSESAPIEIANGRSKSESSKSETRNVRRPVVPRRQPRQTAERVARRSASVLETKADLDAKAGDSVLEPLPEIDESDGARSSQEGDASELIGTQVNNHDDWDRTGVRERRNSRPQDDERYAEAVLASSPTPSLPAHWPRPSQEQQRKHLTEATAPQTPDRSSQDGLEQPDDAFRSKHRSWLPPRRLKRDKNKDPYRLRVVGHSLGGAALLIYLVTCKLRKQNHHIYRLILLTPAGFLHKVPIGAYLFIWGLPVVMWLNRKLRPGKGAAVLIPSTWLRYITFKFTADLASIPALQMLTQAGIRLLLNGDASQWDRAMQMPHYNPTSMPAMSLHTGIHIVQWVRTGRFILFDYGSPALNRQYYGQNEPEDVAANYNLIDVPVDLLAGKADGVIAAENVREHYKWMQKAGCKVTYKEFNFGHLDFTFALKEELVYYVQSRLRLRS